MSGDGFAVWKRDKDKDLGQFADPYKRWLTWERDREKVLKTACKLRPAPV